MVFKKGSFNPTLLSLLPQKDVKHSEPLVSGLTNVEKEGLHMAEHMINTLSPIQSVAACMYAASVVLTFHEKGIKPNCVDLFSDLPVREYEIITLGNELNRLQPQEQAAIYAREAIKLLVKENYGNRET